MTLIINAAPLTLADLRSAWAAPLTVEIGAAARERVARAADTIAEVIASGETTGRSPAAVPGSSMMRGSTERGR